LQLDGVQNTGAANQALDGAKNAVVRHSEKMTEGRFYK